MHTCIDVLFQELRGFYSAILYAVYKFYITVVVFLLDLPQTVTAKMHCGILLARRLPNIFTAEFDSIPNINLPWSRTVQQRKHSGL